MKVVEKVVENPSSRGGYDATYSHLQLDLQLGPLPPLGVVALRHADALPRAVGRSTEVVQARARGGVRRVGGHEIRPRDGAAVPSVRRGA